MCSLGLNAAALPINGVAGLAGWNANGVSLANSGLIGSQWNAAAQHLALNNVGTVLNASEELGINAGLDRVDAQLNGAAGAANTGPAVQVGGSTLVVGNRAGLGLNGNLAIAAASGIAAAPAIAAARGLVGPAIAAAPAFAAGPAVAGAYGYAGACGIPTVSVPAVRYSTAIQTKTIPDHKLVQQQETRVDNKQVVEKYQVADTKEVVKQYKKVEYVPVIKYEPLELEEEKTETTPVAKTLQRIRNVPTVSNHLRTTAQPSYKQVQVPVKIAHPTCVNVPAPCNPCGGLAAVNGALAL